MSDVEIRQVQWDSHRDELCAVRHAVFVLEQKVPAEQEIDGLDPNSVHFLAVDSNGQAIGTARVLRDGHIGRIAVIDQRRGQGVGRALTDSAVAYLKQHGFEAALLNSQLAVVKFYEKLGFESCGEHYQECGIAHVPMRKQLRQQDPHEISGMFELRCTVRDCGNVLRLENRSLKCESGHSFDRAKEGYWNLTQPQDKKSSNPGDSDDAVLARHRWLERGYATGLVDALGPWTSDSAASDRVLDLGCGEGTFGAALFPGKKHFCGIDLSRKAIKLAARRWPESTWVLANADRTLPIADNSIASVMSLFGRRPASEIARILASDGTCIVAIPAEDDLIELREEVQETGIRRSRWEAVVDEMKSVGLELSQRKRWSQQIQLQPEEIADALAMTYRAVRRSQSAKLDSITAQAVTLSAELLLFKPSSC